MIDKKYTYALVGASADKTKYGYKILNDVNDAGFKIIPVNLNEKKILDLKVYRSLTDIKETIDVVIFVVPPTITEHILKEVHLLKIKNVWLQPGSESKNAIDYCSKNKITCMHDICIMIEKD